MKAKTKKPRVVSTLELRVQWLEAVVNWLMSSGIVHMTGTYGFPEYPIRPVKKFVKAKRGK